MTILTDAINNNDTRTALMLISSNNKTIMLFRAAYYAMFGISLLDAPEEFKPETPAHAQWYRDNPDLLDLMDAKYTPLHCAASCGNQPVLLALLDAKVALDPKGLKNQTPLRSSAKQS